MFLKLQLLVHLAMAFTILPFHLVFTMSWLVHDILICSFGCGSVISAIVTLHLRKEPLLNDLRIFLAGRLRSSHHISFLIRKSSVKYKLLDHVRHHWGQYLTGLFFYRVTYYGCSSNDSSSHNDHRISWQIHFLKMMTS